MNADKLTIDAQSALRRLIELFSHTTRFFIIIEDKYKLLKPILENSNFFSVTNIKKYGFLIAFNIAKKEIKNEKLLIFFIFNFIYLDNCCNLENMSII